ncbi:hypothetical protein LLG96_20265 [bacterium]|nr:hypothetical protein [bacterium]
MTTADGSTHIGKITVISVSSVEFETAYGTLTIPLESIQRIQEVPGDSVRSGKYWFPNPNRTRLYFAPTGHMIKKGDGYFGVYEVFLPAFNYGVSDRVSLGGGMSVMPSGSLKKQVFYFTPKVRLHQSELFNIAAGALVMKFPDMDNENVPLISVLYGVGTYGTPNHSITLGFGYGLEGGKFTDKPLVVLGGEQRLSRRTSFVTENWICPGIDNVLISYGIRFFGEEISVDLAFLNTTGKDMLFPGIPYVDFVYNF